MSGDVIVKSNAKIESLRRREQAIKQALSAENVKQQLREQRIRNRLVAITGGVLVEKAKGSSDFAMMLRGILKAANLDPKDQKFLTSIGWL